MYNNENNRVSLNVVISLMLILYQCNSEINIYDEFLTYEVQKKKECTSRGMEVIAAIIVLSNQNKLHQMKKQRVK